MKSIHLLHQDATAESLAVLRIAVFALAGFFLLEGDVTLLSDLPPQWFVPRGPFRWLPSEIVEWLLSPYMLIAMKCSAVLAAVALVLGIGPYAGLATAFAILLFVLKTLGSGFGDYINHSEKALMFCTWVMPLFPAADALALKWRPRPPPQRRRELYAAPMFYVTGLLCVAYAMLGLRRFSLGGFDIFFNDAILTHLAVRSLMPADGDVLYQAGLWFLSSPMAMVAAKIGFFVVTVFEVLSPVCLFNKRFRWVWIAVMVPFHLSTKFTMNIFFYQNVILILVLMVPLTNVWNTRHWPATTAFLKRKLGGSAAGRKALATREIP